MNFRGSKKEQIRKKRLLLGVVVLLGVFIVLTLLGVTAPKQLVRLVADKQVAATQGVESESGGLFAYLQSKKSLQIDNDLLVERVAYLEAENLAQDALLAVLQDSLEEASYREGTQYRVLVRPPYTLYDTLIIERGAGMALNDPVFVAGVYVGRIDALFAQTANVTLVSTHDVETVVSVGSLEAVAVGKGGGMLEMEVPKDAQVTIGDVAYVAQQQAPLGTIQEIKITEDESFKTLLISLPMSFSSLRVVTVGQNILADNTAAVIE